MLVISVHSRITSASSKTRPRSQFNASLAFCSCLLSKFSPELYSKSSTLFRGQMLPFWKVNALQCWWFYPFLSAHGKIFNILLRFYRAENIGKLENYWITRGQIIGDENLWSSILDWGGYEGLAIWEIVNSFIVVAVRCSGKEPHWSDEWDRSLSLFCDAAMWWHQRRWKGQMAW